LDEIISTLSLADSGSGYMAALSICAALYQRENTGVGQRIELKLPPLKEEATEKVKTLS
jgi:crotonobetainyl-CoA:carnitine CoA-transferase CaiB-like acyl-CoA transferase